MNSTGTPLDDRESIPRTVEDLASRVDIRVGRRVSTRTHPFSGEFLDPRFERSFLTATWTRRLRYFRFVGATGAAFLLLGIAVDALVLGPRPGMILAIALIRLFVAGTIALALFVAQRPTQRHGTLDRFITPPMILVCGLTCGTIWAIRGDLWLHGMTALVLILVLYLFLPIRLVTALIIGLTFSTAVVLCSVLFLDVQLEEIVQVILYLTLANILGALGVRDRAASERREFAVVESAHQAAETLRREVGARTAAEKALTESENRFRSLVELSPDAILVHRYGEVLYLNPAGEQLMGVTDQGTLIGRSLFDFVPSEFVEPIRERVAKLQDGVSGLPSVEVVVRTLDGRQRPCEVLSAPILFEGMPAVQSVIRDIAERQQMQKELTRLATTDPLTGLCNRRRFFERFELEWSRARRHSRPLSLLMFDLDHFKDVNDTHGHSVGDTVLKRLTAEATELLRSEDVLARLGGEEFAVVLPEIDRATAESVAERLRHRLGQVTIEAPEGHVRCTVSVGVVQCRLAHESPDASLKRVDDALYRAKRSGRNVVCTG